MSRVTEGIWVRMTPYVRTIAQLGDRYYGALVDCKDASLFSRGSPEQRWAMAEKYFLPLTQTQGSTTLSQAYEYLYELRNKKREEELKLPRDEREGVTEYILHIEIIEPEKKVLPMRHYGDQFDTPSPSAW